MIKRISCDQESFKESSFKPGFNIIIAERTEKSTDKDSRNGAGKTSLVEVIHFLLGNTPKKNSLLRVKELEDWTFTLDLTLNGKDYSVSRNTKNFKVVYI